MMTRKKALSPSRRAIKPATGITRAEASVNDRPEAIALMPNASPAAEPQQAPSAATPRPSAPLPMRRAPTAPAA